MRQMMTPKDFNHLFNRFTVEAFRLETRPVYTVAEEQDTFADFLAGAARPLTEIPFFSEWHDSIRRASAEGRRVSRVRILDEPPTDYQRFEVWAGQFNAAAGEQLRYLWRGKAKEIGLPDHEDWWLFDSKHLAVMKFDPQGHPLGGEVTDDEEAIRQYRRWRDLANRHATSETEWTPAQERT